MDDELVPWCFAHLGLDSQLCSPPAQVGVDINQAASNQWMAPTLQFVAGLGPRKARALLQVRMIWSLSCFNVQLGLQQMWAQCRLPVLQGTLQLPATRIWRRNARVQLM